MSMHNKMGKHKCNDVQCWRPLPLPPTLSGTITVRKITNSPNSTSFDFTGTLGNFTLDTGSETIFGGLSSGNYTITESLVAGWDLTDISVEGATGIVNGTTVTVQLQPGQNVVVTFTNQQRASLTLKKALVDAPNDIFREDFTLTATAAAPNDGLNFSVSGDNTAPNPVYLGVPYVLSETGPIGSSTLSFTPSGDVTVTDGVATVTGPNTPQVVLLNTYPTGTIKIRKITNSPNPTQFQFEGTLKPFKLKTGDETTFDNVIGGSYEIAESTVTEWDLTNISVEGATSIVNGTTVTVQLQPGQNAVVTFTNQQKGSLNLSKSLQNPPSGVVAGNFGLSATAAAPNNGLNFTVNGNGTNPVYLGVPYTLSETGPIQNSELTFTTAGNVTVGNRAAIVTSTGAVTFVNTYPLGKITITKVVDGTNPPGTKFSFSMVYGNNVIPFELEDKQWLPFTGLPTGDYTITEAIVVPWTTPKISVVGADSIVSGNSVTVSLQAGNDVTVTFTNSQ